jgi:ATP-dependent Lon protease
MTENMFEDSGEMKNTYPLLPLRGLLVFPFMITPLDVGREKSIQALEEAMTQERQLVLAVQKSAEINEPEEMKISIELVFWQKSSSC